MSSTHNVSLFGRTIRVALYDPNTVAARAAAQGAQGAQAAAESAASQLTDLQTIYRATSVASTVATDGTLRVDYTVELPDGVSLTAGQLLVQFNADIPNTGPARLRIGDAGTYYPIKMEDGGDLRPNSLRVGHDPVLQLTLGSEWRMYVNPNTGPDGRDGFEGLFRPDRVTPELTASPWGTVSGTSLTGIVLGLRGLGSSIGRAADASSDRAPVASLAAAINAVAPDGVAANPDNDSVGSTVITDAPAIISGYFAYLCVYGMNDFFPGAYNCGQTIDESVEYSFRYKLRRLIQAILDVGSLPLIATSFHAYPERSRDNGHLAVPSSAPMVYPFYRDAPVSVSQQVPTVANSVAYKDRTGFGVVTGGLKTFDHGNAIIREEVARFGGRAICFDYEWASFRYGVEVEPTSWNAFYPDARHNHPNELMYDRSVKRVHKEFALDFISGRGAGKWLYRGDTVGA